MIKIHKADESFCFVECDYDQAIDISKQFEFYAPNFQFSPKYKAGVWDGKIRLFPVKTCMLPQGLWPRLVQYLERTGREHWVDPLLQERGKKISANNVKRFAADVLKCDLVPRDYQILAVQHMLYRKKMVALSATSSGKSFIIFLLFNLLKYLDDEFKFLLVVPTTSLVEQMHGDFCEYGKNFGDFRQYVHRIYSGKEKYTDKPITVSTWQSLAKQGKRYFEQFDCVVVDECHTAGAKLLTEIVNRCVNAVYKVGTSGTLKDTKLDTLALEGLFGLIARISRTKDLMDRKYVAKLRINGIVLKYPKSDCRAVKNMADWGAENKFINGQVAKQRYLCSLAESRDKNTLMLFRSISFGKRLVEILEKRGRKSVFYADGGVKVKEREAIRAYCESHDDAVVVASYGTFSTGINIKNLHNVVFAESMKSVIKVLQSLGRLLRLHESKAFATLFDVTDDLTYGREKNYVLSHFLDRIGYYESEGLSYSVRNVDLSKRK